MKPSTPTRNDQMDIGSPPPGAARRGRRSFDHSSGFWVIGIVFAVALAFSTVPAPLYAIYRQRDGFSTFMITIVFAAYGVGVIGSLFLAGHTSDWLGRRRLELSGLVAELVAAALFLAWPALPGLILARIATGVGVGLITATASAHLGELHGRSRPGAGRARADRVIVLANLGGVALGPLIAGVFAQYVKHPLYVPFAVFVVVLLGAVVLVLFVPETVDLQGDRPKYRPQRISLPDHARRPYCTVAIASFAAFSILGLFTSVSAGFIGGTLRHTSALLTGSVTFLVFGAAATAQILFSALTAARQLQAGLALMGAGVMIVTAAVWWPSLVTFVIGGVIAGAGAGVLFKGSVATAAGLVPPQVRGEALAGLFLVSFIGLVLPVVGIGVATLWISLASALLGFAIGLLCIVAALSVRARTDRRQIST